MAWSSVWTTKPFSILAIRLFHFLVIHGFTELVFLIFFKNLSIAFTAWLTVRCKRPSFQPILAFHKPSSLSLIISNFLNSVQSLSRVHLFATPWITARQASLSITNSRSYSDSWPLSWWCHPTISSSVVPFSSHLQSFPASESFQMSQLFTSGGQSIGVSASTSVLPTNIQDWFPLGWTGWIRADFL